MKKAIYEILKKANRQMRTREIANEMEILPISVSSLLRELEEENLVEGELIDDRGNEGIYWLWRAR